MIALTAESLACRRNGRLLFADLSFQVTGGQALALTGPNGVGKTSLLRLIAGLIPPDAGRIAMTPGAGDLTIAERMVFISSRDPLKNALTVRELLVSWRDVLFAEEGGDIDAALAAFALTALADTPCAYLSSGQRRRAALSRLKLASTVQRPLWLLDEPTNALDAHARGLLARAADEHLAAGGLILAATHDPLGWRNLSALDLGSENLGAHDPASARSVG